jgi:DNA repair protein RadC
MTTDVRERLLLHGVQTLTDAELVAVLLPTRRTNAVADAAQLLHAVGGVPGLARCHPEALSRLPKVGEVAAARLVAALALPWRRDGQGTHTVREPADLAPLVRPLLAGAGHERLAVVICDRQLRARAVRTIADGSTNGCPLPMRDLLATVLRHDGHAFAIAHNHPSGDPTPSAADRNATMRCRMAADLASLRFLSHIVLGEHDTWDTA